MVQILSKEQEDAAFYNDCEGAVLVEASAGSGKTRILTERVRHLLTEKKDKFFSVLCLTFTKKAAEEMKERLKDLPKLSERAFIGTFHEFCLENVIRTRRGEIGLTEVPHLFEDDDKKKILESIFLENILFEDEYLSLEPKDQQKRLNNYLTIISEAKRELLVNPHIERPDWSEKRRILFNEFNARLNNQNAMDYDDILLYAFTIISSREAVANLYRRTYRYILIDEAQDLNYAQYQLLRVICGDTHKNVMMVGDPKQAIYGFNGANPKFMNGDFIADFGATKIEIQKNYRSSNKVLELASSIKLNGGIGNNYFEGKKEIQKFPDEKEESKWIISQIKEWLQKGEYKEEGKETSEKITLDNIAVLARNRFVFTELINQLNEDEFLNNKYFIKKGLDKFEPESLLIKVFNLGLRVIANPYDVLHFNQIFNELKIQKLFDSNDDKLQILLNINEQESSFISKNYLDILVEVWKRLINNSKSLDNGLKYINNQLSALSNSMDEEEKERIVFDLKELEKYWDDFARNTPSDSQTISNFRYYLSMNGLKDNRIGLTLATVHTVKGLEFEIVFIMGMNEGVFPDYRAKSQYEINEEQNNAYVAITRAKRCIYITYPLKRKMPWGVEKPQKISTLIENI